MTEFFCFLFSRFTSKIFNKQRIHRPAAHCYEEPLHCSIGGDWRGFVELGEELALLLVKIHIQQNGTIKELQYLTNGLRRIVTCYFGINRTCQFVTPLLVFKKYDRWFLLKTSYGKFNQLTILCPPMVDISILLILKYIKCDFLIRSGSATICHHTVIQIYNSIYLYILSQLRHAFLIFSWEKLVGWNKSADTRIPLKFSWNSVWFFVLWETVNCLVALHCKEFHHHAD